MAEFPSSQRRGGCGINKKSRSHRNSRRRGGQFGEMFRPEDFAELLLRLRPSGLALRATPAAPNRKGNIFFMARPPLLCEEGNLLSDADISSTHSHVHTGRDMKSSNVRAPARSRADPVARG